MSREAGFTVIIPAHNEEAVIARCLATVLADRPEDASMQLIIAANACSDRTVEIARAAAPDALVLDLAEGSKTKAMNTANQHAAHFPRIYLDADIRCTYGSLAALADALRERGVKAASPALDVDLSRSSALVRRYYKVWLTQPYVTRAMVGSGCFGLSREGYEQIGDFPPIIGDDVWVYSRFPETERRNVAADENGHRVSFTMFPPRRLAELIRIETRRRNGVAEVLRHYPIPHYAGSNQAGDLRAALARGASMLDVAAYLAIKTAARMRGSWAKLRMRKIAWERDMSAREI